MSLASVLQTALTGMSAASLTVDVAANNLANSQTAGFKSSRVNFASQTPATRSIGSSPSASSGGSNPAQIGIGVRVAGVVTESANTDVGNNLVDLTLASHQFRASGAVFRTADHLLDELLQLRRPGN
jgi:flagellar hook protein FlgE